MEGDLRRKEPCQRFVDLVSNERDWWVRDGGCFGVAEEKKLELRLGPPGDWSVKENNSTSREKDESLLSLGHFSKSPKTSNPSSGAKRGFSDAVETEKDVDSNGNQCQKLSSQNPSALFPPCWSSSPSPSTFQKGQQQKPAFLQFQSIPSLPVLTKESSQANGIKGDMQKLERKTCSPTSAPVPVNAAVGNNSQTRTSSVPVVGWPPIRSFRKNLASSSLKPSVDSQHGVSQIKEKAEDGRKGMFIKINMDGVPIGRKIDLSAYHSYEKLSSAVDELFRDLLKAQKDSSETGNHKTAEERRLIEGLLDGSGEYTLVYEDNEGDRMLVGDVPWNMFVTSVKRLRVLKSSELSALRLTGSKQEKTLTDSGVM